MMFNKTSFKITYKKIISQVVSPIPLDSDTILYRNPFRYGMEIATAIEIEIEVAIEI